MVTSSLQGGLGNQMFQISACVALALENNVDYVFDLEKCHTPNQGNPSTKYIKNIFRKIPNQKNILTQETFYEKSFAYHEIEYVKNLNLIGYFQSEKYFKPHENYIKKLFTIENVELPCDEKITSVHIRRGDYVSKPEYHNVLDKKYYESAIDFIGEGSFIFFSDDMPWVKENFKSKNYIYSDCDDEISDFYMMSKCDNNIISNSSFSWWAAYLNKNLNKKIVTPKHEKWFGVNGPKDTQDLIPIEWIQI